MFRHPDLFPIVCTLMNQVQAAARRCAPALTLGLAGVLAVALMLLPAAAQTAVPATAPHPAPTVHASGIAHVRAEKNAPPHYAPRPIPTPGDQNMVYANGPVNGLCDIDQCEVDGWTINFGYATTNSFPGSHVSGFQIAVWSYPGDTVLSLDYSIGSDPFAGTPATVTVSSEYQFTNYYGYDIDVLTVTGLNADFSGTAWLTLQNAVTTQGNPLYWDENGGPSQAQESALGTIPSESFNIEGSIVNPGCDDYHQTAKSDAAAARSNLGYEEIVMYRFTNGATDGKVPANINLDRDDNVYGTSTTANGCSLVYKITAQHNWQHPYAYAPLYQFSGGDNGCTVSSSMVFGPDGGLYGTTSDGGGTGCGGSGCGTAFTLKPPPKICSSVNCPWTESPIYRFQGNAEGQVPFNPVVDAAGNLYFIVAGGAYGFGGIDKLTRSGSTWLKSTVYDFSGAPDGANPNSLLMDAAGNLYGTTGAGGSDGDGTVFELTPAGNGWDETIIHSFAEAEGSGPFSLILGTDGSLYGLTNWPYRGTIFMLQRNRGGDDWNFTKVYSFGDEGYGMSLAWSDDGYLFGTTLQSGCDRSGGDNGDCWTGLGKLWGRLPEGEAGTLYTITPPLGNDFYIQDQFFWGDSGGAFPSQVISSHHETMTAFGVTWAGGDPRGSGYYGCGVVYNNEF